MADEAQTKAHARPSLPARILRLPVRFYQIVISPVIHLIPGSGCRFHPSCSQYAIDAMEKHGAFRGIIMGSCRILRCNPFCRGGFDPVPEKFSWRRIFSQNDVDARG